MLDPHPSAHKVPFKWLFAGGPTLVRFYMFSFDVSFYIMPKSTIIYSDKHFGAQKSLHDETVLLSTKKLTLKVIENTILHTTCTSVRLLVRTILLFVFVLRSNKVP